MGFLNKMFSVFISLIIVLGCLKMPIYGANQTERAAAAMCEALDVLRGSGSGVTEAYLNQYSTRLQAAIINLRLQGIEDKAIIEGRNLLASGAPNFPDINEKTLAWADGRSLTAFLVANKDAGFDGKSDGTFAPDEMITGQMFAKVLLVALGYVYGIDFTWQETMDFARQVGITSLIGKASRNLTNYDIAEALEEALKARMKGSDAYLATELGYDLRVLGLSDLEISEGEDWEGALYENESDEVREWTISPDYTPYYEINEDMVGWIKIPDTIIDYPILQGNDNAHYLHADIYNNYSVEGCIIMDFRVNIQRMQNHTLIYGHNMKRGTMFHEITSYKDEEFYNAHPYIEFDTLYDDMLWEVFSVHIISKDYLDILDFPLADEDKYQAYLDDIVNRAMFDSDVEVTTEDQILTLITCSYEFDGARTIVHAKLVESDPF